MCLPLKLPALLYILEAFLEDLRGKKDRRVITWAKLPACRRHYVQ